MKDAQDAGGQVKEKLDQELWLADNVVEATKVEIAKRKQQLDKDTAARHQQLNDLLHIASETVESFRVKPPADENETPAAPTIDSAGDGVQRFKQHIESIHEGNDRLAGLGLARMPTVTKLAQRLNIRVYQDRTETLDDIYTTLNELGALLDKKAAADERIASIKSDVAAITQRIDLQVNNDARPTVLFVVGRDPAGIRNVVTVGKNTFVSEIIRLAGGRGAFDTSTVDYPQLNAEAILAAKPDVIIEVADPATPPTELAARKAHWPALGNNLPAVRNDRIHILTDDYLLIPSPRVVQSIKSLADVLHPTEGSQPWLSTFAPPGLRKTVGTPN